MMALEGIRVLDLSTMATGPFCSALLSELGADVIKVEAVKGGDPLRYMEPLSKVDWGEGRINAAFVAINKNKRSVRLKFRKGEGKETFLKMVECADVIIENFKPGSMDSWGLGYEELSKINKEIIYCHVSGYGLSGPYSKRMQHEGNINALAGAAFLDEAGVKPRLIPGSSMTASFTASTAIVAALYQRTMGGGGQLIDVSTLDSLVSISAMMIGEGGACSKEGFSLAKDNPRNRLYECKDGKFLFFGPAETRFFNLFLKEVSAEFLTSVECKVEQIKILSSIFKTQSRDEWCERFLEHDVCISPLNSLDEAFGDPQINSRNMIVPTIDEKGRCVMTSGSPFKMSKSDLRPTTRAPHLGEHTNEVLSELGIDK
jgi:crotonobetainyl-CoA:carnitine CoA-transferase CaiB-like acyl-CoA transferase